MAERLRRLTRNQIPSGSVGSNPTNCEKFLMEGDGKVERREEVVRKLEKDRKVREV